MDKQLEQTRDAWMNAFYTGNVQQMAQYEDAAFKVIYEHQGVVETNLNRYEMIQHAVDNGVWKPHKPEIQSEAFEFDRENTQCRVTSEMEKMRIHELWNDDDGWKVMELRFSQLK
ncbi:hypothetical protein [Acinetobacter sp. WZC-1]|uniref:hypothetical protein n=1 Tax=Acinetobacter sp. WZC-1 TaxID=3459034 RepID=UPI00403DFDB6